MAGPGDDLGKRPALPELPGQPRARIADEVLALLAAERPQGLVGTHWMASASGSIDPRQRPLPHAWVHRVSAHRESQLGTCTPLVTCPTGTSSSGQRG